MLEKLSSSPVLTILLFGGIMDTTLTFRYSFPLCFILLHLLIFPELIQHSNGHSNVTSCFDDAEKKALIKFKEGLIDPFHRLSSWGATPDCCKWTGITCDDKTGHVIKMDLHNPCPPRACENESMDGYWNVSGRINPSLLILKHLQHLDLSYNSFNGNLIPEFIGSMENLMYLNLSGAGFSGRIPPQLGNLSNLISLDVAYSSLLNSDNLEWLGNLCFLQVLNMNFVNLSTASHDCVHVLNRLPSLLRLHLGYCSLSSISPTLSFLNFTSLCVLDLSGNYFNSEFPNWIANISTLVYLDLSWNELHGLIPYQLSEIASLEELSLEFNRNLTANCTKLLQGSWSTIKVLYLFGFNLYGEMPLSIGNITSLEILWLSFNKSRGSIPRNITSLVNLEELFLIRYHVRGHIPDWMDHFKNLRLLALWDCMLIGQIPGTLGSISSLQYLSLRRNQLNGIVPTTLGKLSNLIVLDISSNQLTGNLSESYFQNLRNLAALCTSSNLLIFNLDPTWLLPFQLKIIRLKSCSLGPRFPQWLQTQKQMLVLDLSNTSIHDAMPSWFWALTDQLDTLNLSHNMISGQLPNHLKIGLYSYIDLSSNNFSGPIPLVLNGVRLLRLSNNHFSGPIPLKFTIVMHDLIYFFASNNDINGTIPMSIGEMELLIVLDLSRNNISGIIPSRLGDCKSLEVLDLSNNRLFGKIPESLSLLNGLKTLHLNNNNLSGELLMSLKNCTHLETLDLGDNKLTGSIPTWIGESFSMLRILRLRSNKLEGTISQKISLLASLQVFDVAQNRLIGSIPQGLENFSAMKQKQRSSSVLEYDRYYMEHLLVSMKGSTFEYTRTVSLVTCIDLSRNNLSGNIPKALTSLLGLRLLNLSRNHLTGRIPDEVGSLTLMESLDISRNQLSGEIPQSMSALTFLAWLNMSYNNLSGRIPSGHQLQALPDPSIYIGNPELCGPPLNKSCNGDDASLGPGPKSVAGDIEKDEEVHDMLGFYASMALGFVVGFWGFCGILVLNKSWRIAYFRFMDKVKDRFIVRISLWVNGLKKFRKSQRS